MSDVAQKVWIRGRAAYFSASAARATSSSEVRQSAATLTFRHWAATALTAAKSPSEAIGKPASMMSTPRSWSFCAIRTFSVRFIEQPGDCSPSRKVVSKMLTLFCGMGFPSCGQANEDATEGWANSQSYNLYRNIDCFYPQITQIICVICGLLSRHLRDSAGILLKLAGVIQTCEI